ncbi:fibrinogen-like protein A [Argopecten irradians]|uniref:fibrinogen-like protein A n=1 Tax=Argopecten irradians TaxID=31199 RepID=UPI00371A5652
MPYLLYVISILRLCSSTIITNKYNIVSKVLIQNHQSSLLTSSNWKTKVGCASTCESSSCLSFSYNTVTGECRTYGDEICYRDDGVTSSSVKYYVKYTDLGVLRHCGEIPTVYCSGVYTINPTLTSPFSAYCDIDTASGPWTVVANRYDGSVSFYESWSNYKDGFGSLTGEFWMGFENYRLLQTLGLKMRIEMEGWDGSYKYVEYSTFIVSGSDYTLSYSGFSSPHGLGDKLNEAYGMPFSTYDNDNDDDSGNCASSARGGWWYDACYSANLFGERKNEFDYGAMVWKYFYPGQGEYSPVQSVKMMVASP